MNLSRQAWWDGMWPATAALLILPPALRYYAFAAFVCLDLGHTIAPIAAAWLHREFRAVMLRRRREFIVWPITVAAAAAAVGVLTQFGWTTYDPRIPHASFQLTDLGNPFPILVWIYWGWNIWHFSLQNFGVARLCGLPGSRETQLELALALTISCMAVLPALEHSLWLALALTGAVAVNHWIVEIGLSSRISGTHWLIPGALAFGALAFLWTVPTTHGTMIRVIPALICARLGLGYAHFLYGRMLYKFSDPALRATIGKDLFAHA